MQGLIPNISDGSENPLFDATEAVQASLSQYETLQNTDCICAYVVEFITNRRTLVLVAADSEEQGNSLLGWDFDAFLPLDSH